MGGGGGGGGENEMYGSMEQGNEVDYSAPLRHQEMSHSVASTSAVQQRTGSAGGPESEPSGVIDDYEVVYVKDNVSVHPTQNALGRISGRLRLIKQGSSLFMTWIPYSHGGISRQGSNVVIKGGLRNRMGSRAAERDRNLYTIRAVSLSEMRSIRRQTPPFGWQYIIIVLTSGLAFPPLYFHNGGVKEFLGTIRNHALLVRSAEDANVYLVNDIQDPLQRSLTSLELTEQPAPSAPTSSQEAPWPVVLKQETPVAAESDGKQEQSLRQIFKQEQRSESGRRRDQARDLSMNVLEKFSLVTKFARETTAQIFGESRMFLDGLDMDRGPVPRPPPGPSTPPDVEVLGIAKEARPLLENKHMKEESSSALNSADEEVVDDNLNADDDAEEQAATNVGTFELVDGTQDDTPALVWGRARPPPLGTEEWRSFLDSEGRVMDPKALRKRIFHGGIEPEVRHVVWKFLLGYFRFDSTYAEREYLIAKKKEEYEILKAQWQTVSPEQAKRFAKYRERKHRVEKDVVRTDRTLPYYAGEGDDNANITVLRDILVTYSFYNFDLGYCQGMSDLLSPILYVVDSESEAFWCFAALMEHLAPNFHRDQNGMHSQLLALSKLVQLLDRPLHDYFKQVDCLNYFFCFRWILIQFKREFDFENVLKLWEVLWTNYLSEHFHLYMCVALLKRHRRRIMDEQMEFDTLLKFINELSGHINLESTLRDAEALCLHAGERGAACIPPGTPPSIPEEEAGGWSD
ncbi:hypothetical protein R1flu_000065 [Riccia fluitans]|uniref:TBC1 domain family member 15 n=1 Tax=Riccia fluitans TaxID=41844 RepID=A0ABD1XZE8_9MARC